MMKLRYSTTSPYVRKVMVTALETGLDDRIERIPTAPFDPETDLVQDNPLSRIPTLTTEGGEVLYDSPVVCEYLDSLHDGIRLFPPSGGARWTALRRQALGDGILDAALARRLEETLRPEHERSPSWIARQWAAVTRSLDALEEEASSLGMPITIGHVAIGCALGYLDFRFGSEDWRPGRTALADWYAEFSARRSMMATVPVDPK